ncbi:hypothetical protein [Demequina lignilytica]|uniref:Uncharacterized protein n=1 Tax=Demequina lignilytica TaxID=3051663 RepID=A0AB35MJM6_9MICO|nr:hypothetical protein [Demequina sp. SYSU T0a273]MDN4483931.1 hypothetical protein [Demequina sp. SYSU T0a273]
MAQGDDTTREETQVRTDLGSRGPEGEQVSPGDVPDGAAVTAPHDDADTATDELATVTDTADATGADDASARPSVLPPDVAAARTAMHRRTTEIPIVTSRFAPVVATGFGEDDAADPLVDADAPASPEPAPSSGAHHRPHVVIERRAGLWFAIALLTVLLIGVSTLAAYLWHVSDEWRAQVEELTDVSYGLGDDLAAERETLAAAEERIDLLTDQLATSKDTVSRLQAENARWGDDAAFAQEQIGQLEDLIATGTAATSSLNRCIEANDQLVAYLEAPDDYDPEEIVAFEESVAELCTEANRAAQEFTTAAAQ